MVLRERELKGSLSFCLYALILFTGQSILMPMRILEKMRQRNLL